MKKIFFLIFSCLIVASSTLCKAGEPPLFVSLGASCEVAHVLRDTKARSAAYPFDWLLTLNPEGFVSLLQNNFESFLKQDCLKQIPTGFTNTLYDIEFRHDLYGMDTSFEEYLPTIQEKHQRRISRFRNLNDFSGKVFFLRSAYPPHYPPLTTGHTNCFVITSIQAKKLQEALVRLFPKLNFTLVIVNYAKVTSQRIVGIDKVVEYTIGKDVQGLEQLIQLLSKQK